jgi:hypothetical protein
LYTLFSSADSVGRLTNQKPRPLRFEVSKCHHGWVGLAELVARQAKSQSVGPDVKQIVFLYNNVVAPEETITDLQDNAPIPVEGTIFNSREKNWRVVEVQIIHEVSQSGPISVHRVYLSDQL